MGLLGIVLVFGCGSADEELTTEELAAIGKLSPLPPLESDPTNAYADNPAAAALGKKLFFETRYSGAIKVSADPSTGALGAEGEKGKVACASCHDPGAAFMDRRSNPNNVSLGVAYTTRNTPSLVNVAYYTWHGWAGKQDSLWTQASLSPESSDNTGGDRCGYAHMLFTHYRAEYDAIFAEPLPAALDPAAPDAARFPAACKPKKTAADPDGPWEMMDPDDQQVINRIMANQAKAVAAYERLLISGDAPFDRYVAGETDALSGQARRGLRLFIGKAACVSCHSGPLFTDNKFYNDAVPQVGANVPAEDLGRFEDLTRALNHTFNSGSIYSDAPAIGKEKLAELAPVEADRGAFRTKGLRGVAETAPYFHNGSKATLLEVVEHYNAGGAAMGVVGTKDKMLVPLNLTRQEMDDLVAFLEALSGEPLPADLTDPPELP
jgi:cytochrome c peroxidase